jgi:WhiB family redox-sensing transcriptional regulator
VPGDWFVDPVQLGVPGVRRPAAVEDDALAWQTDALCAQTDPEAFFPEKGGSTRDAKRICTSCEVRSQCLEYALQNDERFGIWGGLSERERRRLKRRAS